MDERIEDIIRAIVREEIERALGDLLKNVRAIIREEIEYVVRSAIPAHGPLLPADAVGIVSRFLDQAEYLSVRALEQVRVS